MDHKFAADKPEELEKFLKEKCYFSGETLPGCDDAKLIGQIKDAPDRKKYPHLFAWWWNLCAFTEAARAHWGKKEDKKDDKKGKKEGEHKEAHKDDKKGDHKDEHKGDKKDAHKEEKKDEKKEAKPADDDDLFGEESEADKKVREEAEAKKKEKEKEKEAEKKKKAVIAKSRIVFDVKGFEVEQDWEALGNKILKEIQMDGLVWQPKFKVVDEAFGMKKVQMTMTIEDDKVSADDVLEKIQAWEDEVQSCDIVEFNKA